MQKLVFRFFFRWFLVLAVFSSTSCSHQKSQTGGASSKIPDQDASLPDPAKYDQLVIVGTNDFHGFLSTTETKIDKDNLISGGAEWFGGYINILQKMYGDQLVLLDAGDIFQGTLESNSFLGQSVLDYYNILPYRAASVGNHEFDYGPLKRGDPDRLGALKHLMAEAKFPFLAANIYLKGTNKLWREKNLLPSVIVNAGPYHVGIIGLTTISTVSKTLPQNIEKLDFRDFREATIREAKELREQGAEVILVTTHEGGNFAGEEIAVWLSSLPPHTVDAVVSGHYHSEIAQSLYGVPVIQSKTRGLFFGRIDLFVEKKNKKIDPALTRIHRMHSICGTWYANMESCDPKLFKEVTDKDPSKKSEFLPLRKATYQGIDVEKNEKVTKVLQPYFEKTNHLRQEILANVLEDSIEIPYKESGVGQLFLEAFAERFPKSKVVYLNGGGFRTKLSKGTLSYGDLYEAHPFDNYAGEVKMTGKLLKSVIQVGISGANFVPSVKGIKVKYHKSEDPAFDRDLNGDGKKEKWERNRLVSLTWENGKTVKDSEVFWMATNDFLISGGDHLDFVFSQIPIKDRHMLELNQRDVTAEYLRKHKNIALPIKHEPRILEVQ